MDFQDCLGSTTCNSTCLDSSPPVQLRLEVWLSIGFPLKCWLQKIFVWPIVLVEHRLSIPEKPKWCLKTESRNWDFWYFLYLPPWNIFIAKKMSSFEPVPTMICSGEMASNPCNFAIAVRNSAIPEKRETREIGWPSVKFKLRKNFLLFCNLNLDLNFRVSTFRGPNIRRAKQERRRRPCEKGAPYSKRDTQWFFSSSHSTQFQCYSTNILIFGTFWKKVLALFWNYLYRNTENDGKSGIFFGSF